MSCNYLGCASWARNVKLNYLLLGKLTSGIVGASIERAVSTVAYYHISAARLTLEACKLNLLLFSSDGVAFFVKRLGVLTGREIRTGKELAESSLLVYHLSAAKITNYVALLCGDSNLFLGLGFLSCYCKLFLELVIEAGDNALDGILTSGNRV